MKTDAVNTVAALIIVATLAFSLVVAPEHLAWHESNEHCIICRLIQHMPLLEPGIVTDIVPLFHYKEFLLISEDVTHQDPKAIKSFSSRAPPLS